MASLSIDFTIDKNKPSDSDKSTPSMSTETHPEHFWSASSINNVSEPTDMSLLIENWQFNVHKSVLAEWSDYFKAMFSSCMLESSKNKIKLQLFHATPFKTLIEGIYSKKLELTHDNIYSVAELARILQIKSSIFDQCVDFLKSLIGVDFGLEVMFSCECINVPDVYNEVRQFCLAHFSMVRHTQSFMDLTLPELYNYLSDKYLVVEEEIHVVESLCKWYRENEESLSTLRDVRGKMEKIVADCVALKDDEALETITGIIMSKTHHSHDDILELLGKRSKSEDVFLFWSLLQPHAGDNLIDIVKLNVDTGMGNRFGSMNSVIQDPGFDMGSAICTIGSRVYLSGGGPKFGGIKWIRQVLSYDITQPEQGWKTEGHLVEFRRYHAMVAIKRRLYIFGGFGNFRVRNEKLQTFDLDSGTWAELPPMPVSEISPAATAHGKHIYYIDKSWKVHCFDTVGNCWYNVRPADGMSKRENIGLPPVALHVCRNLHGSCLVAVVIQEEGKIQLPILQIQQPEKDRYVILGEGTQLDNEASFEGSVMANGKLLLFLGLQKHDTLSRKETCSNQIAAMTEFDPTTRTFSESVAIQNIKKALSYVALPHLPSTFQMGKTDMTNLE